MATYIKGHKNFYPDIKPFTPDYKFLSATMDARQQTYDANWKAQNDLYNRVVYSDLTNPNSVEYQRQFTEKLGPELEKITGLDLSLEQNVQSAKSVFAPFFQDDTVVYDMVWTGKFNDAFKEYNQISASPNAEVRQQVNPEVSKQKLLIDREKFMNAGRDQILNQPFPELIMDADLVRNAQKFLSALDPALTITQPVPNMIDTGKTDKNGQPIFKQNNDWIITQTNGSLVEGEAYEQIVNSMYNDPRVVKYYDAKSYVQANNFAKEAVQNGRVSSEEQGLELWATETISRLDALNIELQGKAEYEARLAKQININWTNYAQTNGVVPGSVDEQILNNSLSAAEQTALAVKRYLNQNELSQTPDIDPQAQYNKASTLLANYNMDMDMRKAARQFSMRGLKIEQEENKFSLKKYESDLRLNEITAKHNAAMIQKEKQQEYDLEKIDRENRGMFDFTANMLSGVGSDQSPSAAFYVDENFETSNLDDPFAINIKVMERDKLDLELDMVKLIPEMLQVSNKYKVEGKDNYYMVPLVSDPDPNEPTDWVEGTPDYIEKELSNRYGENNDDKDPNAFEFEKGIIKVFGELSSSINSTHTAYLNDPDNAGSQLFNETYAKLFAPGTAEAVGGVATRWNSYTQNRELALKDIGNKALIVKGSIDEKTQENYDGPRDKDALDIQALMAIGFLPPIEDGTLIDKNTYFNNMVKLLESGEIDPTQSPELFGALNNTDFINDISLKKAASAFILGGSGYGAPPMTPADLKDPNSIYNQAAANLTNDREIDRDKVKTVTDKIYDYYYNGTNKLLTADTDSQSYINNSKGISSRPTSNISFNPVSSVNTNLQPKPNTQENIFVGNMISQIRNPPAVNEGGFGFLGGTFQTLDKDDLEDIAKGDIPFDDKQNKAAEWLYNTIITQKTALGDNAKLAFKASFYPTWGFDVIEGDNQGNTFAAYQFSNFDSSTEKLVKAENKTLPEGVDFNKDVKPLLQNGFTYIFPRNSTVRTNSLSFSNTNRASTIINLTNNSPSNVYTVPNKYATPYFVDGQNAGPGRFKFIYSGGKLYSQGQFHVYESDATKYPKGYSIAKFPKQEVKGDPDVYYQNILTKLEAQHTTNEAKYRAKSNIAKSNNQ